MGSEQIIAVIPERREQTITVAPEFKIEKTIVENDVNFYDFDGTLMASYSKEEFANIEEFPSGGKHNGLTSQGWNWDLADAKAWVARVGWLDIGHTYRPTDNKTHIFANIADLAISPAFGMAVNGTATVDWGDGSSDTLTGTSTSTIVWTENHEYANGGRKEIKVSVEGSASIIFTSSTSCFRHANNSGLNTYYQNAIDEIWVGANVQLGNYFGAYLRYLKRIVIPVGVTTAGTYCCSYNSILRCVVFPKGMTAIGNYAVNYSGALAIFPKTIETMGSTPFSGSFGTKRFAFLGNGTAMTSSASLSNAGVERIAFGNGVTTIMSISGNNIQELILPDALTALPSSFCYSYQYIKKITIPANVATLGTSCFGSCFGLEELHFKGTTPPTTSTNCFNNFPTRCKIFVPKGTLSAYTSANRFPSADTYTYIEE